MFLYRTRYHYSRSSELLPRCLSNFGTKLVLYHLDIVSIQLLPREVEKLVLILPAKRLFLVLLGLGRRRRGFGDFGDQISGRSLSQPIYEDSK